MTFALRFAHVLFAGMGLGLLAGPGALAQAPAQPAGSTTAQNPQKPADPQKPSDPQKPPDPAEQPIFRAKVNIVRVDVSVTGRDDEPLDNLQPSDFAVKEDG